MRNHKKKKKRNHVNMSVNEFVRAVPAQMSDLGSRLFRRHE